MARPSLPDPPHTGGCLCGAVRFEMRARPLAINACHCTDCKRASGGTHTIFIHARAGDVTHSGALLTHRKTADSGRKVDTARCVACGTRLWHHPVSAPELMFIAAGVLDAGDWAVPTSHIFTRSMAPDVTPAADALVYDGPAPDRQLLWDRFAALYG
jgi:hypothetical protein